MLDRLLQRALDAGHPGIDTEGIQTMKDHVSAGRYDADHVRTLLLSYALLLSIAKRSQHMFAVHSHVGVADGKLRSIKCEGRPIRYCTQLIHPPAQDVSIIVFVT